MYELIHTPQIIEENSAQKDCPTWLYTIIQGGEWNDGFTRALGFRVIARVIVFRDDENERTRYPE